MSVSSARSVARRILSVSARNFRNLIGFELEAGAGFNIISGDNGAGKSNLLESIYYLFSLRSFRGAKNEDLIRENEESAEIGAEVVADVCSRNYRITIERGERRLVTVDEKRARSKFAYRAELQMVLFWSGSISLVTGAAELRGLTSIAF